MSDMAHNQRFSPIGWVPSNWNLKKLSSLADISYGISDPIDKTLDYGLPLIGMPNVTKEGTFKWDERFYIIPEKVTEKNLLKKHDILFNWRNGSKDHLGKTVLYNLTGKHTHVGFLLRIRCNDALDPTYCDLYIKGIKDRGYFLKAKIQVNNTFNKEELSGLPVVLPPLPEQQKIAQIISTWDKAIEKLEALIAAKQKRKKALMQRLLTGKKRLPGFEDNWRYLKANAIYKPVSKKTNGANEELLAVTQDQGVLPRNLLERRVVMPEGDTEGYKLVVPGNFIISLRSFQGGLEYSNYRGLVSPAYTVLQSIIEISDDFYRHYLKSYDFIGHLAVAVIGIRDGKQISYADFSFLKLPYPPIAEQQKIASVLSVADKEIETYQKQLVALKQQKKSLMQQLLTGKKRVQVRVEEAA